MQHLWRRRLWLLQEFGHGPVPRVPAFKIVAEGGKRYVVLLAWARSNHMMIPAPICCVFFIGLHSAAWQYVEPTVAQRVCSSVSLLFHLHQVLVPRVAHALWRRLSGALVAPPYSRWLRKASTGSVDVRHKTIEGHVAPNSADDELAISAFHLTPDERAVGQDVHRLDDLVDALRNLAAAPNSAPRDQRSDRSRRGLPAPARSEVPYPQVRAGLRAAGLLARPPRARALR